MGASGDLAPLSHLALGLMGEGKMWSPKSGWADAKYVRSTQKSEQGACSEEPIFNALTRHVCFVSVRCVECVCLLSSVSRSWRPMDLGQSP